MAKERLISIINFCLQIGLFFEKDGFFYSKRLLCHKEFREFFAEKGREGAKKRWGDKGGYSGANAKERKEKERLASSLSGFDRIRTHNQASGGLLVWSRFKTVLCSFEQKKTPQIVLLTRIERGLGLVFLSFHLVFG